MNILLVDDDSSRWVMALFLRDHEFQVTVCSNGSDALEQLASRDFDLVITDINMPDMAGTDLIKSIGILAGKSKIKIIVCTAYEKQETLKELKKEGVYKILMKPIQIEELISVINSLKPR